MTDQSRPLFLFGPGFSALALARIWTGKVFATARRPEKAAILSEQGIRPVLISDPEALPAQAHWVVSAPPSDMGCPGAAFFKAHRVSNPASVTYLSTTGVYGDLRGGWAFDWSGSTPSGARGGRRVLAETQWRKLYPDVSLVRLPGIYGPGRSALDRVRNGKARRIIKPGQVFSRIHVEDLARGLKAIITSSQSGEFNLCDDEAAPPQDVIAHAAALLGLDIPPEIPFEGAELSPMARSFYADCKRVSNARLKAATGWRPQYPTYREGLSAILASEQAGD